MTQVLGQRTVRDAYRVFAGFMREAVRQGLIRQSPCLWVPKNRSAVIIRYFPATPAVTELGDMP